MNALICLILSILAVGVFGSRKRDLYGNRRSYSSSEENRADIPTRDWERAINTLAGTHGPKYRLIGGLDTRISNRLLNLGKLEVVAFEFITSNPNRTIFETAILLNEQISRLHTIDGEPIRADRISFWHSLIHRISIRSGDKETLEQFLQTYVEIVGNDRGILYLNLSPRAWDQLVYPFLLQFIPRVPPRFRYGSVHRVEPARNPREFTHLPFTVREYVLDNFFGAENNSEGAMTDQVKHHIAKFDSSSKLLDEMLRYYHSIRALLVMDFNVFQRFFAGQEYLRCGSDEEIQRLADEWNTLFNQTNPPVLNSLYTVERVSFWCKDVLAWYHGEISDFQNAFKPSIGSPVSSWERNTHMSLASSMVTENLFNMLGHQQGIRASNINVDDVLLAWEQRPFIHE